MLDNNFGEAARHPSPPPRGGLNISINPLTNPPQILNSSKENQKSDINGSGNTEAHELSSVTFVTSSGFTVTLRKCADGVMLIRSNIEGAAELYTDFDAALAETELILFGETVERIET